VDAGRPAPSAAIEAPPGVLPADAAVAPDDAHEAPALPYALAAPAGIWAFPPHGASFTSPVTVVVPGPADGHLDALTVSTTHVSSGHTVVHVQRREGGLPV
jgi:hypothetical protein